MRGVAGENCSNLAIERIVANPNDVRPAGAERKELTYKGRIDRPESDCIGFLKWALNTTAEWSPKADVDAQDLWERISLLRTKTRRRLLYIEIRAKWFCS